jgi:hypothetical protein
MADPLARTGRIRIDKGENGSSRSFDVGIHQLQIEQVTLIAPPMNMLTIPPGYSQKPDCRRRRAREPEQGGDGFDGDCNGARYEVRFLLEEQGSSERRSRSAEEAGAFVKKLQSLLRRLGAGDGDMEKVSRSQQSQVNTADKVFRAISVWTSTSPSVKPGCLITRDARLRISIPSDFSSKR